MDRQTNLLFIEVRIIIKTRRAPGWRIISCYNWSELHRRQHFTPLGPAAKFTNIIPLGYIRGSASLGISHSHMPSLNKPGTYLHSVICKFLQTSLKESSTLDSQHRVCKLPCARSKPAKRCAVGLYSRVYVTSCKGTWRMSKKTTYLTAVSTLLGRIEV